MSNQNSNYIIVFITISPDHAQELASKLVTEKLAACVNILPAIRSIYQWQGEVCDDEESLLIAKTEGERFDAFKARVERLHPYEVPEIIALPIEDGHPPYLRWISESVSDSKK